jgi:hypothetical protein
MVQNQDAVDTTESERDCSQFDYLLVAIPLALLAGVGSVVLFPIPQFVGVTLGAAVAGCLVAYGVYAITQSVSATAEDASESYTVAD